MLQHGCSSPLNCSGKPYFMFEKGTLNTHGVRFHRLGGSGGARGSGGGYWVGVCVSGCWIVARCGGRAPGALAGRRVRALVARTSRCAPLVRGWGASSVAAGGVKPGSG